MKILKIIGISIIIFLTVSIGCFLAWYYLFYKPVYSPSKIESYEINNKNKKTKLLITSQGSDYKINLVDSLTNDLKDKDVYIKVIDVTKLPDENKQYWNCIIIINMCEKWRMQKSVRNFLKKSDNLDNIIIVTTSGPGTWKTKKFNIDTITSASEMEKLTAVKNNILKKYYEIVK